MKRFNNILNLAKIFKKVDRSHMRVTIYKRESKKITKPKTSGTQDEPQTL